jgi:hypothetical protein
VRIDPLTIDAESPRDLDGIHEPDSFTRRRLDELSHAPRDRLDVIGVQPPAALTSRIRASAASLSPRMVIIRSVAQRAALA